jgi:hypothetical protein
MNLAVKLKEQADVELVTDNFIGISQHAAKEAMPNRNPQQLINNLPSEIKKPVTAKRKTRSTWQKTHTPDS